MSFFSETIEDKCNRFEKIYSLVKQGHFLGFSSLEKKEFAELYIELNKIGKIQDTISDHDSSNFNEKRGSQLFRSTGAV